MSVQLVVPLSHDVVFAFPRLCDVAFFVFLGNEMYFLSRRSRPESAPVQRSTRAMHVHAARRELGSTMPPTSSATGGGSKARTRPRGRTRPQSATTRVPHGRMRATMGVRGRRRVTRRARPRSATYAPRSHFADNRAFPRRPLPPRLTRQHRRRAASARRQRSPLRQHGSPDRPSPHHTRADAQPDFAF